MYFFNLKKRMVAVREHTGILRYPYHHEREKMLQVYFPKSGKPNYIPFMFDQTQLEVPEFKPSN